MFPQPALPMAKAHKLCIRRRPALPVLVAALFAGLSVVQAGDFQGKGAGTGEGGRVGRELGRDKVKRYGEGLAAYQRKV